jgi:hypothetical protein
MEVEMDLKTLSEKFLVKGEATSELLAELIERLLPHCVVHMNGMVDIATGNLTGKDVVKLVLSARLIASKLPESSVKVEVTAEEIEHFTGLPKNQAAARAKELVDEKFAERTARGSYKARQHKVNDFVRGLPKLADREKER